jgi:phosphoenolpyruvate carboxylase
MNHPISLELRSLVSQSVAILGDVIQKRLGRQRFNRIEKLRIKMTELRGVSPEKSAQALRHTYQSLEKLPSEDQQSLARAYTLMLELMNACESAYRSLRIRHRELTLPASKPESSIYFF